MAHHKSALKRIRQSKKRRLYNRLNKRKLKYAIRDVRESKTYEAAMESFKKVTSLLDKLAIRGIIHKNYAANRKSALSKFALGLKNK